MASAKQPYNEGDLVVLPLESGGFGVVLIARRGRPPLPEVYLYGFGQRLNAVSDFVMKALTLTDVVWYGIEIDSSIVAGRWKVVGRCPGFTRESWPLPVGAAWKGRVRLFDDVECSWEDVLLRMSEEHHRLLFQDPVRGLGCGTASEAHLDRTLSGTYEKLIVTNEAARLWAALRVRAEPVFRRRAAQRHAGLERKRARREARRAELGIVEGAPPLPFWDVIAKAGLRSSSEQFLEDVRDLLILEGRKSVSAFRRELSERLKEAKTWDLWAAAFVMNGGCSDDGFLYFRLWLVAQGREVFEEAVRNPDSLANGKIRYSDGGEHEMEGFLDAIEEAYDELGADAPDSPLGGSSRPKGKGWKEQELASRFPMLWKKFGV